MRIDYEDEDFVATTGSYINVYSQVGGFDIYVIPSEPNPRPELDEVDTITETIVNCKTLSDIYMALNALDLKCLEYGFTILEG